MDNQTQLFSAPQSLGLQRAIELVSAPTGHTFFYRNEHKRVIEHGWRDEYRCKQIRGPLLYAVTDGAGVVRYFGKWESDTALDSRWYRHSYIHHQTTTRQRILAELDSGRGPLSVWAASVREIRNELPAETRSLREKDLAVALEAAWINRWKCQLWNKQRPSMLHGFSDGNYWRNAG